jgi:bacteriocin biosynthesis cyclodehydratase domain-containing protein
MISNDQLSRVLTIAQGLDVMLLSDDELLVQYGTRSRPSELFRDADLTGLLRQTIGRLLTEGPLCVSSLLSRVPESRRDEAIELIDGLLMRGMLTYADRDPVEQYLRYTFEGEPSLGKRTVSLIGAGPIGARIAHSLLQHGIERLVLVDDREVDELWNAYLPLGSTPSNQHSRADEKVKAWLLETQDPARAQCIERGLKPEGIEIAVQESSFVVLALEQPNLRLAHLVNRLCLREHRPWILAGIDGNFGLVGPLFIPGYTGCYNDYLTLAKAATQSSAIARKHQQYLLRRSAGKFFPGLPCYAEIVAGHATLACVHFLLRDASFATSRIMMIDFDHMVIDIEDVLKLPRCAVCGVEKNCYRTPFVEAVTAKGYEQSC